MSVGRICSRCTHLAGPEESVLVAADRMKDENVGTLLVVDADRRPVGILTDRDLAVRVVAPGLDARATTVGQVMTAHPRWVGEETPIEDAVAAMRGLAVRRMPVVDGDGRLAGIVSVDDVLELVTEELGNLGRIVGASQPGAGVPATRPSEARRRRPATAGLERASSDLEC
jgi:signal-transduction protein with cAMP-binding, CBS, and nucleotidyltransferase domain